MAVDPSEAERADEDIHDDFKLRKRLVSMVYTQRAQPCEG